MIKAYKGFNQDMTCLGFQYEEGKTYETDEAIIGEKGFHSCEEPINCFRHYNPGNSVYHEVEVGGNICKDAYREIMCSTVIKIGKRFKLRDIIYEQTKFCRIKEKEDFHLAHVNYQSNVTSFVDGNHVSAATKYTLRSTVSSCGSNNSAVALDGLYTIAVANGLRSIAVTSGSDSTAGVSGYWCSAQTIGRNSVAVSSGDNNVSISAGEFNIAAACGIDIASYSSGRYNVSVVCGNSGEATAIGYRNIAVSNAYEGGCSIAKGQGSLAISNGNDSSAIAENENSIAVSCGENAKAKGVLGSHIVLVEWDNEKEKILNVKSVKIDGVTYKEDTSYFLKDGEILEEQKMEVRENLNG